MPQMERLFRIALICIVFSFVTACSYNPFSPSTNRTTGSATGAAVGAGVGAGSMALLHAPKALVAGMGLAGAGIGYYATTLRFQSGPIIQAGGQVYSVGDYVTIEIPSDKLFDVNTAELLPEATPILDSTVTVLNRYPSHNILISGNTSGFASEKYERKISEDRARQVAAYLYANGVSGYQENSNNLRKLIYVGYNHYFPIANDIRAKSIRQNSRIQITAYPSKLQLHLDKCHKVFNNIGDIDEAEKPPKEIPVDYNREFPPSGITPG
jgi:outer membrane protein OmpA-like peptidoglycan-associated protein